MGLIMQKLRDLGLDNNTLVIFTRYCSTNSVLVWVCERVDDAMFHARHTPSFVSWKVLHVLLSELAANIFLTHLAVM